MSRSMAPNQSQLEKLVDLIDNQRFLVTGYARTAHARDCTRAAWQEIANILNSDGNGCIKTWQQWAKYWKDKKAALKKKVIQINQARRRTGGGVAEEMLHLTRLEERLLALVGGESFAIGDRELEINPFENPPAEPEPPSPAVASNSPPIMLVINDEQPNNSDSILQGFSFPAESMVVQGGSQMMIEEQQSVQATPEPQPGPSRTASTFISPQMMELNQRTTETVGQRRQAGSAESSPGRRRVTHARRRLLQRTPPAQRNSQMASLTERFIALEERRVNLEMMPSQAIQSLSQALQEFLNK